MDESSLCEGIAKTEVDENYIRTLGKSSCFISLLKAVRGSTYGTRNGNNYGN